MRVILILTLGLVASPSMAQQPAYGPNDTMVVYATVMPDGSLVPTGVLPDVEVVGKMPRWMAKKMRNWTRLRNAVYVTYPYAREAGRVINDINYRMALLRSEREKTNLIKSREAELKKAFGDRLMNLSVYQGKVLMKLINRETGNNCYDLLKEYRGGVNARMWQTVAFFFGSNLKQSYEPRGEDAEIESIVQEVKLLYFKG